MAFGTITASSGPILAHLQETEGAKFVPIAQCIQASARGKGTKSPDTEGSRG